MSCGLVPDNTSNSELERKRQLRNEKWKEHSIAFCGDESCGYSPGEHKCHTRGSQTLFGKGSRRLGLKSCESIEPKGGWRRSNVVEVDESRGVTTCGCGKSLGIFQEHQTRCDRTSVNSVQWNPLYKQLKDDPNPDDLLDKALKCCMWPYNDSSERGLTDREIKECGNLNRGLVTSDGADPTCVDAVAMYCNMQSNIDKPECVDFFGERPRLVNRKTLEETCKYRKPGAENDPLCGCHYNSDFYKDIKEEYKKVKKVGEGGVSESDLLRGGRNCWYDGCRRSKIRYEPDMGRECSNPVISQCIQGLNIDAQHSTIKKGKLVFSNTAQCRLLANEIEAVEAPSATEHPSTDPPAQTSQSSHDSYDELYVTGPLLVLLLVGSILVS